MFTLATLIVFACVVVPAAAWALKLAFRIAGWTLRMVLGVLLLPVWIILAVVGGLAAATQVLLPFLIIAFVIGLIAPEG